MIHINNKQECCGCTACVQVCPVGCISLVEDYEGFNYPTVSEEDCLHCGKCDAVCPISNNKDASIPDQVLAVKAKDDEVRKCSSSGGVFSVFAEHILGMGGVVFGAAFDEKWNVVHRYIDKAEDMSLLRGSKYVQSDCVFSFKQVEAFLRQGRQILFTGTPCQIAGLKSFLGRDYDNLWTMDFVCHGVPSPGVWRQYLKETLAKKGYGRDDIESIFFRDKRKGWKNSIIIIKGKQDDFLVEEKNQNAFLRGFLRNLYLRPSCHDCRFRGLRSGSDVTVADFWGVEDCCPDFDDDMGVSAVLLNTKKGKCFFEEVSPRFLHRNVFYSDFKERNSAVEKSPVLSNKRLLFFSGQGTVESKVVKLTKVSRVKQLYRYLLSKI